MNKGMCDLGGIGECWAAIGVIWLTLFAGCAAPGGREIVALPGIRIQPSTGEIRVDGRVCLERGILEYLAVTEGGKEYESAFALHCRPSHLHTAMLIARYQPGEVAPEARGDFGSDIDPAANEPREGMPRVTTPPEEYFANAGPAPTRVLIDVDVQQPDGRWRRQPIEYFLIDRNTGKSPPRLTWGFTGSFFHRDEQTGAEFFVADFEKSLIALWYDPTALLNLVEEVGNPYRDAAVGLEINPANLSRKGTPVRIILRPVSEVSGGRYDPEL